MTTHARRSFVVSGLVLIALALAAGGCDGDGPTQAPRGLTGQATFPESVGGGPVANAPFTVFDLEQGSAPIYTGKTNASGFYAANVSRKGALYVVVQGEVNGTPVRVSGLTRPGQTGTAKNLDGATDIACEAGVTAVTVGALAGQAIDRVRILNLELSAAREVPSTNFLSKASVTAAAIRVRQRTNDGANPG